MGVEVPRKLRGKSHLPETLFLEVGETIFKCSWGSGLVNAIKHVVPAGVSVIT